MSIQEQHPPRWTRAGQNVETADVLYLIAALLLIAVVAGIHFLAPVNIVSYERDVWHHMAVLDELMKSPFDAKNPHVVSDAPSRGYMPWYVLLAVVGRAFGIGVQELLGISAALSLVALAVGVHLFARAYFARPWAPLILLGVMLGTWVTYLNHTGFHTLPTLIFSASYPFAVGLGLGFVAWWLVLRALRAPRTPLVLLAAIAGLCAFLFATHQLQGAFAIGGALVFGLFHGTAPLRRRAEIVAATLAGLFLCRYWIYFDPVAFSFVGENYAFDYRTPIEWTSAPTFLLVLGLSTLGLIGLYDFEGRTWRFDLLAGIAGIGAGILAARILDLWIGLRFLPFLVMFLQIALTAALLDLQRAAQRNPVLRRRWEIAVFALCAGVLFNIGTAAKFTGTAELYLAGRMDKVAIPDWARDITGSMSILKSRIAPGSVVVAEGNVAYPIQASGMKVVSIPRPFPEVADAVIRQQDSLAFFDPASTQERRCAIIDRYQVAAIAYRVARVDPGVQQALRAFGSPMAINDLAVIQIPAVPPC